MLRVAAHIGFNIAALWNDFPVPAAGVGEGGFRQLCCDALSAQGGGNFGVINDHAVILHPVSEHGPTGSFKTAAFGIMGDHGGKLFNPGEKWQSDSARKPHLSPFGRLKVRWIRGGRRVRHKPGGPFSELQVGES